MAEGSDNSFTVALFVSMLTVGLVAGRACPAPTPCLCDAVVIDCRAHNLPSITPFSYIQGRFNTLLFGVNNVTAIHVAAFAVLNVTEIHLDYNLISSIDYGAFRGLETTLRVLNLAHNRLQTLPGDLATLATLANLDISFNPIDGSHTLGLHHGHAGGFNESVMKSLGDSLTSFTFGDDFMLHWPGSLHHLNQLQELNVASSTIDFLAKQSFHGFEQTLRRLTISHASLNRIPLDVGVFSHLEEFHFDHNRQPDGDSVILPQPLVAINRTLKTLSLTYDNLKVVPLVLKDMGNLQNISLDGNPLEFVSQEAIGFLKRTQVKILSFRDCSLKRIPGSLSDLSNLLQLDFSKNLIRTIESVDLRNIPTLQILILARNPLKFISRDSFIGLTALSVLDMSYSEISVVPESIANLDNLKTLDFRHALIDCTCELSWMRRLMEYIKINVLGRCETIDQAIQDYIMHRVPNCPDYIVG